MYIRKEESGPWKKHEIKGSGFLALCHVAAGTGCADHMAPQNRCRVWHIIAKWPLVAV